MPRSSDAATRRRADAETTTKESPRLPISGSPRRTDGADPSGPTQPPPGALETISELRVRYGETDQMGFVYHAHYLVWCDVGRTDFIRALGTSYAELERGGLILAVSDAQLRYLVSARYDDVIHVRTRLVQARSRAVYFGYDIVRAQPGPPVRLATATTTLIALDANGSPRTLPPEFRAGLAAVATPPG